MNQYFKYLQDVKENGPLHFFDKKQTKTILKKIKWYDRFNHIEEIQEKPQLNIAKKGDTLFFSPTQCLHDCIPNKNHSRLMMTVILCAIPFTNKNHDPFYFENHKNGSSIWSHEDSISRKYLKPARFWNLIETYKLFKKNKLN